MSFWIISGLSVLLALVAIYIGGRFLWGTSWIIGWLRGCVGVLFLTLSVVLVLSALDLFSYRQFKKDQPVAMVSLEKVSEQHYQANVSFIDAANERSFQLRGDQWQLDARVIRWRSIFSVLGAKPGYRLDRISGRYFSLEDERREERSEYQIAKSRYGVDIWQWFKDNGEYFPIIEAGYGSATYLPMAHGALFQIGVSSSGLVATPVNSVAEDAVSAWQ